ncbi:MAG: hypothetical protein WCY54_09880, partial [Syntrophales bacterium]
VRRHQPSCEEPVLADSLNGILRTGRIHGAAVSINGGDVVAEKTEDALHGSCRGRGGIRRPVRIL